MHYWVYACWPVGHIVHPSLRKRDLPIECAPSFESCKRSWIHRGCLASNALDFGEKRPKTERLITLKIWRMSEIWDLFGTGVWEDNAVAVAQFLSLCQLLSFWLVNLCQPFSFWFVGCYSWQLRKNCCLSFRLHVVTSCWKYCSVSC